MSLFSDLASSALGAISGNNQAAGGSPIVQIVSGLITSHSSGNGLAGLLQELSQGGLASQVSSWVGTGANQPVTADQIHQALGPDQIAALAQKAGIPAGQLTTALAQYLPHIIDQLTPNGQVPQAAGIESALGSVLQSGLFRQLTGGH